MKKTLFTLFSIILIFCFPMLCYAGDIPETLLHDEGALVFFGEVSKMEDEQLSVVVREVIKGNLEAEEELIFSAAEFVQPILGETYLCGVINGNDLIYLWEVTSFDTKTLEIKQEYDMAKRMQKYLNEGQFEEAQAALKATAEIVTENTAVSKKDAQNITVIGGADGPTSIFIAGKIGETKKWVCLGLLVILLIAAAAFVIKKKRGK